MAVFEFFTGSILLIAFVALKGKFCDYFGNDEKEALDHFVSAFVASHIKAGHWGTPVAVY